MNKIFILFKTLTGKIVGVVIVSLIVIALLYHVVSKLNLDPKVLGMVNLIVFLLLAILGFTFKVLLKQKWYILW